MEKQIAGFGWGVPANNMHVASPLQHRTFRVTELEQVFVCLCWFWSHERRVFHWEAPTAALNCFPNG